MSIPYLEYLERCPAEPGPAALRRLARAPRTTPAVLLGAGLDAPPGRGVSGPRPALEALEPAECRRLLSPGGVGRVAFAGCQAPQVLPVNYALVRGDVVIRAAPGTALADAVKRAVPRVGFEVDHLYDALSPGWSVLVIGQAYRIVQRDELAHLYATLPVRPWPGGDRDVYVRITPDKITGRWVRAA